MSDAAAGTNSEDRSTELKITVVESAKTASAPEKTETPWKAIIGAAIALSTVVSVFGIAPVLWIMGTVKESNAEVRAEIVTSKTEMKETLKTHAENPHVDAVPREVYIEHVKKADERHEESKADRKEILKRLDRIGRRTHGSDKKWERAQDEE
jgi:hypothetical protein